MMAYALPERPHRHHAAPRGGPGAVTHPAVLELKKIEGERFFRKFDDWLGLMLAAFQRDDLTYLKILVSIGSQPGPQIGVQKGPQGSILLFVPSGAPSFRPGPYIR